MAHVREKRALGLVGGLGLDSGLGELFGSLVDDLFQMGTVVFQLLGELLFLGDVFLDRNVVRDLAIILTNRRDDGGFDEQRPVLAPVVEKTAPRLAAGEGFPERFEAFS